MLQALGALAGDDISQEQMAKQILRHQLPIASQVESLVSIIKYQKSLIPQHIINPLIDSTIKYVTTSLNKLKIDEEAEAAKKQEILKKASEMQNAQSVQGIEEAIKTINSLKD